jgi:hypothetical protein
VTARLRSAGACLLLTILAVLLIAIAARASVTRAPLPLVYELHSMPDNKIVPGDWPKSDQGCDDMAQALIQQGKLQDYSCIVRRPFKVTTTCADEKAPLMPLTVKDADGFWALPPATAKQDPKDDTNWITVQRLYAHNPSWPGGYPNCWVPGEADSADWCVNAKDADHLYMARRDDYPQECEDSAGPNTAEPTGRPPTP